MKLKTTCLLAGIMLFAGAATSAHAGNGMYDIEIKGLQGLSLGQGQTVWQPEPVYPRMALRRGLTGEVLVQYSVNADGKAENIEILESSPKGFFNGATVRILEGTTFSRSYDEGQAVTATGLKKRFIYDIIRDDGGQDTVALRVE